MKFKNLISITTNKANQQISFNLKKKKLRKIGITPEQLMETKINFKSPIKPIEFKREVKQTNGNHKRNNK